VILVQCVVKAKHNRDREATHKITHKGAVNGRLRASMVCCEECGLAVTQMNKAWELQPLPRRLDMELPPLGG
jgi:hypothetical protein